MLTKLVIRNFKCFDEVEIDLGDSVVFIGPNNSGKTSAMQALTLWDIAVKRWNEARKGKDTPEKRIGVAINRNDLLLIPHPRAKLLWGVQDRRIELVVEGADEDQAWACGIELEYANSESFYCRPLRIEEGRQPERMPIPRQAASVRIALLPPMSGLASTERRLDQGAVNVLIGEGRTADVLRNLCFRILDQDSSVWEMLAGQIKNLFGAEIEKPAYIPERGEITMSYRENGLELDLSSSGRGLQQTLLILAYMYANPGSVILLDEPDAHLETLRQRQIYRTISEVAAKNRNQIIAASHSEVLLNEAADKGLAVAFVGKPHRFGNRKSQVLKALAEIGYEQYFQAGQTGWVLYLEESTDLSVLHAFARRLGHDRALQALERPFVKYAGNDPSRAAHHFYGLREALPGLKGIALFDRLDKEVPDDPRLELLCWKRREIENYLCSEAALEAYAVSSASECDTPALFSPAGADRRLEAMRRAISRTSDALRILRKISPWDNSAKASDDFLIPLFETYFHLIDLPVLVRKGNLFELAKHVPVEEIDSEIVEKLDAIADVAESASSSAAL